MFLRKLVVMVLPLVFCAVACLLLPLTGDMFFSRVLPGLALGILLALVLPLTGAVKRREPFGVLLWVPTALLTAAVVCQYLLMAGMTDSEWLRFLTPSQPNVILIECAFIGFLATTCLRTRS